MAPALIETMSQDSEGKFGWHPIGMLQKGDGKIAQSPLGSVALKGTAQGFDVHTGESPIVDHVLYTDTDEWEESTTIRTFTDEKGQEIRLTAVKAEVKEEDVKPV